MPQWSALLATAAGTVVLQNCGTAHAQYGLDDAEYLKVPSRCEHYPTEQAILCGEVVTWPVQMFGIEPGEPGYITMEEKLVKEQAYKDSLLPLLDREGCKTDFLLFICPMLYQPCFEIDAAGNGATAYEEEIGTSYLPAVSYFPKEEAVRLPSASLRIFPRNNCAAACKSLHTGECAEKLGQARSFQEIGATVVPVPVITADDECVADVFGGPTPLAADDTKDFFVTGVTYPPEFDGQPIFPVEGNVVEGFGTIPCFDVSAFVASKGVAFCPLKQLGSCDRRGTIRNPYAVEYMECIDYGQSCEDEGLPDRCAASICPDDYLRESGENACNLHCIAECPEQMFTPEEISMMWLCMIVPALLGLPLNMYAAASYVAGGKTVHKKTPVTLKFAAGLAVVWTFFSIFPVAALFTDTVCKYDTTIQQGGSDTCTFLRGTLCILQSMLYWVLASVIDLHLAVVNGKTPAARKDYHKCYHVLCWGVPLLMYVLTYAMEVTDPDLLFRASDFDGEYPALNWNRYKDIFSCSAKLQTIELELVIVWSHFILAAAFIFGVLCSILYHIGKIYKKQSSKKTSKKGDDKVDTNDGGCFRSIKEFKKAMDKYGATKLTLLGLSAFTLVILLIVTILDTFPKMNDFNEMYEIEYSCSITELAQYAGQPCLDDYPTTCCYEQFNPVVLGVAPNPTVLGAGYYMSLSLIPLIFGVLFGVDSKHANVWKKVFGIGSKNSASVGSVISSSA